MSQWERTEMIQAAEIPLEMGARAVARTGAGVVLEALREAGTHGLNRSQIVAALGCWGNEKETTEIHSTEIDKVIAYLCEMGVARVYGVRWYIVSGHELLNGRAA